MSGFSTFTTPLPPKRASDGNGGRRALLIFADQLGADLAKRRLPSKAQALFRTALAGTNLGDAEVHLFTSHVSATSGAHVHRQVGATFSERLENAVESLARLGFDEIVMIGRDCPSLRADDIALAFEQLREKRLVLGPDHRGGCYLLAFRAADRALLRGILWKQNTDCAELRARCDEAEVLLLAVKHDLDSWADLRLLAHVGDAAGRLAASLVELLHATAGELIHFVDLAAQAVRVRGQMPPPALIG